MLQVAERREVVERQEDVVEHVAVEPVASKAAKLLSSSLIVTMESSLLAERKTHWSL